MYTLNLGGAKYFKAYYNFHLLIRLGANKMRNDIWHDSPFVLTRKALSRRKFLKGTGVVMSLPFLESMVPAFENLQKTANVGGKPRRLLAICNNLGLLADYLYPKTEGKDYESSPYLELLKEHRNDFTIISGVSHPNVAGAHSSDVSFLTAAPHPGTGSFRNTISIDQFIAERIGSSTRFPSLVLAVNSRTRTLSYNGSGVGIPPEDKAAEVFRQMFVQGTPDQVEAQLKKLDTGRSVLDTVSVQAKQLQKNLGARDRQRLDQYFESVRELESRLQASRAWERKPKPVVNIPMPVDPEGPAAYMDKVKLMYQMSKLAFETDSTRVISLMLNSLDSPVLEIPDANIANDYHDLSHHGKAEAKIAQLKIIDAHHMKLIAELLSGLKAVQEQGDTLLDRTMIIYGSNLGDANTHSTVNMPIIMAGGGFRHGQHLAFSRVQNYPLPNLFVSVLQRMGLKEEKFASSTGTMKGLEMV
jgi:hypothetical protein